MTSVASGENIHENLTPAALTLFHQCLNELSSALNALPDKPDETPISTLAALWHTAAGRPVSARRAIQDALPELDQAAITKLAALLRDRIAGIPLAYLTGRQQFMGVELFASDAALIPREETELLGTAALTQLRAVVREQGHATVLDVCTGSGNLALALAWHEPHARVWAADLAEDAIALARRNLAHLGLASRVEFRTGDLLAPFDTPAFHGIVDLLICNPPYISSGKVDGMPGEIIGHEPRLAFDGGALGIRILLRLISEAPRFLRPGGWLAFELGLGQGPGIRKRLEQGGGYVDINEVIDGNGQIRALIARLPQPKGQPPVEHNNDSGNAYSVVVANVMADGEKIRSLWRTGLNATTLGEAKFDWYYQRNPDGAPDALMLLHSGNADAVGVAAVGHRRMRFNNEMLLTAVTVDFVVHPEHRTLFPALLLQKELCRRALQTHHLVWGLPNLNATAVFSRAGYQLVGQMVRYARVLRSAEYLARYLSPRTSRVAGAIIDWILLGILIWRKPRARSYRTKWQQRPDARFDDLWQRTAAPDQLMGVRDEQYLAWRFGDYLLRAYSFFTLVSAVDQCLIAYAVCEADQHSLHVRDFLIDPNIAGAAAYLWHSLLQEAYRKGLASLSVEFLGSELVQEELKDAGLTARDQTPLYAALADESRPLLQGRHWYLTCADVDG